MCSLCKSRVVIYDYRGFIRLDSCLLVCWVVTGVGRPWTLLSPSKTMVNGINSLIKKSADEVYCKTKKRPRLTKVK